MIPIPDIISPYNDWSAYWEDFITDEEFDFLLNNPAWNHLHSASVGGQEGIVAPHIRSAKCGSLEFSDDNLKFYTKLSQIFARVNASFFQCDITSITEPLQFIRYDHNTEDHYDWHTDMSPEDMWNPRKLAMVLMLSDTSDFEGGQLEIKTGLDVTRLEQKKGRAWFFPSYILHRVTPVTKGERKVAVMWVQGKQWR